MRHSVLVAALLAIAALFVIPSCYASVNPKKLAVIVHGLNSTRAATNAISGNNSDSDDNSKSMVNKGTGNAGAAVTSAAARANSKLPDLDYHTAISKIELASHESAIIACIGIAVGALLCFAGQAYFKVFLGLVGLCFGGLVGLRLLGIVAYFDLLPNSNAKLWAYGFVISIGLIGASLCLCLWNTGIFVAAATAGYFGTSVIIAFPVIEPVANTVNRHTLLVIGVIGALVLAWYFRTLVVAVASSVIGAFILSIAVDMFLKTGFKEDIYNMAVEQHPEIPTKDSPAYGMYVMYVLLVAAGVVCQILFMRQQRKD